MRQILKVSLTLLQPARTLPACLDTEWHPAYGCAREPACLALTPNMAN
jgi:hypothetical protein